MVALENLTVLGVDPGSQKCGWGVIHPKGSQVGVIEAGQGMPKPQRLYQIYWGLGKVFKKWRPQVAVIEQAFVMEQQCRTCTPKHKLKPRRGSPRGAIVLGEARGIVLVLAAMFNVEIIEAGHATAKKAATGNGRSSKEDVRKAVMAQAKFRRQISTDEADAWALAAVGYQRHL